jgi:putative SOS response-associated peptidase YedK
MCNLCSMTKSQDALRQLVQAMRDTTGNLPPMPGIFPDYPAPIVRNGADGVRELAKARWGMPSPKRALEGRMTDPGGHQYPQRRVTALAPLARHRDRCLVPFTSFFRIRHDRRQEGAGLVRARREPPNRVLRGPLDLLD